MPNKSIKNISDKSAPGWQLIDASGLPMGRVATEASKYLQGKHKVSYIPYQNCGDHVVVINIKDVYLSGNKLNTKEYYSHSGYPGNLKTRKISDIGLVEACSKAIYGMLPTNKLRDLWMKQLHIYETAEHPHQANLAGK